jgi:hypothetical protein
MHFGRFSFGSVQIDGSMCEHDVVIDRGSARKDHPSNFANSLATRRCPWRKTYPGNAASS